MSGGSDNQTTSVQNPPWMDQASQQLLGNAQGAVAGSQQNPLQTGAYGTAAMWGSMAPGALGQAYNGFTDNANYQADNGWLMPLAGLLSSGSAQGQNYGGMSAGGIGNAAPVAQANTSTIDLSQMQHIDPRSVLDYNIGDYTNPYQTSVIDAQAGDIERARQLAGLHDAGSATSAGAFGGSRQGVVSSLTNSEYDRNQAENAAQMRAAGYNAGMGLIQGDIANATGADQFNAAQQYQALLANAGMSNAGSQFNAGQMNAQDLARIAARAQTSSAATAANASMHNAGLNAGNERLSTLINGALGFGQMGLGADLNAATLRGNSAQQLMNFGQGGMGAEGGAGDAIRGQPFDDLGWYSGILGNIPHGQSSSQPVYHNRGAGAVGGAATGAQMGSNYGGWGTAIGALGGGLMGYFGS